MKTVAAELRGVLKLIVAGAEAKTDDERNAVNEQLDNAIVHAQLAIEEQVGPVTRARMANDDNFPWDGWLL